MNERRPQSDIDRRIADELNGTPERAANYLNSGRAAADLRELICQRDEARNRYRIARMQRQYVQRVAARLRREARDAAQRPGG